ncbi:MAG: hypothetical protein ACI88A_005079 [Paraglaciecola sp.]|jgi:hypothetical protein
MSNLIILYFLCISMNYKKNVIFKVFFGKIIFEKKPSKTK